jgi:hypothetical protein
MPSGDDVDIPVRGEAAFRFVAFRAMR